MNRFYQLLWKPIIPLLAVGACSLGLLLLALTVVDSVDGQPGRPGPFDLKIHALGDASFVIIASTGLLFVFGLSLSRWAIIVGAEFFLNRTENSYKLQAPFPVAHLAATGCMFDALAVLAFYLLRAHGYGF